MSGWRGPIIAGIAAAVLASGAGLLAIPQVLMGIAVDRLAGQGGLNRMMHPALARAAYQPVVRPSPDLAYSTCPFDLTQGPLVIDVAPVAARYSSLSIFDARTDVIFVRNDAAAQGKAYRLIVALPQQRVPPGAETVRTEHARGIALIRLLLTDPSELTQLQDAREQSSCRTMPDLPTK